MFEPLDGPGSEHATRYLRCGLPGSFRESTCKPRYFGKHRPSFPDLSSALVGAKTKYDFGSGVRVKDGDMC